MEISAAAILFDNDGVLVDSHEDGVQAWTTLCDEFGLDFSVIQTEFVGCRPEDTLARHVAPDRLAEAVERLEDLEVSLAGGTRPLPGALELLASLDAGRWAIATSAGQRLADARWKAAGIAPPVTVAAEDITKGKPAPDPYVLAAERLGVDPADCLVFEDSPAGGLAGRAAGAQVVAVGDLEWPFEPLARVPDLSFVTVTSATSSGTTLIVDSAP